MQKERRMIRIRQLKLNIENSQEDNLIKKVANLLHIPYHNIISYHIIKKSIDARKKDNICFVYTLDVEVTKESQILRKIASKDIYKAPDEKYTFKVTGKKELTNRPIIIGSGPAGLFCAYLLAEHGYKPLIIERGEEIDKRIKTVEHFWKNSELNENSNVQFGEGGAGTFSDGKLNTLVKDKGFRNKKVLEIFVENKAPAEIIYLHKPHIGTDKLRGVIKNMRNKIISLGGSFRMNTILTNIFTENNRVVGIEINNHEKIPCDTLVLAIGHSARDTVEMLLKQGLEILPKPFAVGVRIEHPQALIDNYKYGSIKNKKLPPADYKLTYTTKKNRGVYSFCMCPGGFVVNASSEKDSLSINGMSNYQRDEQNANSAIVVTVTPKDFGNNPTSGIEFQKKLEKNAYKYGQGNIPIQLYKDFKDNKLTMKLGHIKPVIKGNYTLANLNEILPDYITESLKEAIPIFDEKIKGFAAADTILLGVESRTSSPIKIPRDNAFQANIKGIYPCGEGSGYAGGITTSSMDGIKIAEQIAKEFKPLNE